MPNYFHFPRNTHRPKNCQINTLTKIRTYILSYYEESLIYSFTLRRTFYVLYTQNKHSRAHVHIIIRQMRQRVKKAHTANSE